MTDGPLFSTIVPVYNRPKLVRAALDSVLVQKDDDQEIIVVDDGSTDNTPDVLADYGGKITVLRQEHRGPGAARNLALQHATGQYIAMVDSDDLWLRWTLATYREAIEKYDRPALIASDERTFTGLGGSEDLTGLYRASLRANVYSDYCASYAEDRPAPLSGATVRADVLRSAGGFDEHNVNFEETDLWLRLGVAPGFVRVEAPFCSAKRVHDGGASQDLTRSVNGALSLIEHENAGRYPGDTPRRRQRLTLLARRVRQVSAQCLDSRRIADAWRLYRMTFRWHMRLGRARHLLGFPASMLSAARKRPAD